MPRTGAQKLQRKILDFDIETRLVGFFQAGKFAPSGSEPIAIACSWIGKDKVEVALRDTMEVSEMLRWFVERYDQADMVTGHYIRKFDLPILQGALMEHGLPPLSRKLTSDTKLDLITRAGLSASQENLGAMYQIAESKYHMNDARWREATRLTPEGVEQIRRRVMDDVKQHKALRLALIEAGFLGPPRSWNP